MWNRSGPCPRDALKLLVGIAVWLLTIFLLTGRLVAEEPQAASPAPPAAAAPAPQADAPAAVAPAPAPVPAEMTKATTQTVSALKCEKARDLGWIV
jgi:hypothetical protein